MNEREIDDSDSSGIPSEEKEDDLLVDDSDEEEKIKEPEKHETSTDIFT